MRLLFFLCLTLPLVADPLTEADREALTEKIAELESSPSGVASRFANATKILTQAVASEANALQLYEASVETVRFKQNYSKPGEFREWSKRNNGTLKDKDFQLALRHRCQWQLITIKASRLSPEDFQTLSPEVERAVVNFLKDAPAIAKFLGNSRSEVVRELQSPVMKGYIAEYLGVETLPINPQWPQTITPLPPVYERIIMPPLRKSKDIKQLADAWDQLISYEKILVAGRAFGEDTQRGPNGDVDRFTKRDGPSLLWRKELDLYRAGDQRGAAARMFSLIETNKNSPDATKWLSELKTIVSGPAPAQ